MTFNGETTTDQVLEGIDLSGRHAVVTGAAAGLGTETARSLAAAGAAVTMTGRNAAKLESAMAAIRSQHPDAEVSALVFDLASLASVAEGANELLGRGQPINMLINNAGVMMCPQMETADGFEMQIGTNHLGHFAFAAQVAPALSDDARVVSVSSAAHLRGTCDVDDLNWQSREYDKVLGYSHAKTANIWFASELQRHWGVTDRRAFSLHPGVIATDLSRHVTAEDRAKMSSGSLGPPTRKTVAQGAATSVYAATSPDLVVHLGAYLVDCSVAVPLPQASDPRLGYADWAYDVRGASKLWQRSQELTGVSFK